MTDPRLEHLIRIDGGPTASALVVGVPSGPMTATLNVSSVKLARAMGIMRTRAAEIRAHSQLLPSEKSARLDELRAPALAAAREHQRVLADEKARIMLLAQTASPVKTLAQVPGDQLWIGQLLATKLMTMPIAEKTQVIAQAIADPVNNLAWTEALLRYPCEVTGADREMLSHLRRSALEAMDPALSSAIEIQKEQLALAERADDIAQQALAETLPGSLVELRQ